MVKCDSEIMVSLTHLANGLLEHDAGEELSANPRTKIPSESLLYCWLFLNTAALLNATPQTHTDFHCNVAHLPMCE